MRGDVTDAGRTPEQLKIELLSRWNLEAESCNFNVHEGGGGGELVPRFRLCKAAAAGAGVALNAHWLPVIKDRDQNFASTFSTSCPSS